MVDLEGSSPFVEFAKVCESVRQTRSKIAKTDLVSRYFLTLKSDQDLRIAATFLSGRIFPPGYEFGEANVGYSLIWSTFAKFMQMQEEDLSRFYMKHGDLGSAVEDALNSERRSRSESTFLLFQSELSLESVYSSFSELAKASGKGSQQRRRQILTRLFATAKDPIEAKYLVRLLTGEMRIGLVEGLVEESIAKAFSKPLEEVRSARLVTADIGLVAQLARHNRLSEAKIELFRPTTFMLADSGQDATDVYNKFEGKSMIAEFKYDGIRAQIHAADGSVKIFSRNLEDVSDFFPEIRSAIEKLDLPGAIVDGEIIAFESGRPKSFQSLQRRLRKIERTGEETPIKYVAFDLLYFEKQLIEEPLSERSKSLHSLNFSGVLDFSEQRTVTSPQTIQRFFEESKSLGYEGLVVKDQASFYTPGRRGKNWVKLKKELDTLDVVIVAAEYGHGKRAGVISDYTFAVRDGSELKTVGKAYSGLTDLEIKELTDLLKQITLKDYGYRRTVIPRVVLEVAFDAIQKSERHDSGFALRFPRIKRIRTDKSVEDIDSLEKVKQIYEAQKVRL
ncbi:MAG: ATP-dependent DNA ligase [Nitrososphaerota archaeon]|nr:ATP-dependent DNA ligase [Nitrososphaerota archaeon]